MELKLELLKEREDHKKLQTQVESLECSKVYYSFRYKASRQNLDKKHNLSQISAKELKHLKNALNCPRKAVSPTTDSQASVFQDKKFFTMKRGTLHKRCPIPNFNNIASNVFDIKNIAEYYINQNLEEKEGQVSRVESALNLRKALDSLNRPNYQLVPGV